MADGISAVFKILPGPGIGSGGLSIGTYPGGGGLNATGKKFAFCGPVWFQDRTGTKDIRRVGFRWSTVTKAGGSAMTISLQNVSTSATPLQPDETQDQTVAVANADAAFVSNTWYRTGAFSADRTVAFGEMVAVVVEFDGAGRLGADTINVASRVSGNQGTINSASCFKSGGVWTCDIECVNMVFEFSDGTFGTMAGGFPCSAVGAISYNSGTLVADEYALEVKFTKDVRIDLASWAAKLASASADYEFLIYDGTTAVATVTIDGSWRNTTVTTIAISTPLSTPITLTAGTLYRFALRPTTVNPIEVYYHDVADANHWVCHVGGPDWRLTSRLDQGAWAAATTTRRLYMQPHVIFEFAAGDPPAPDASWPCNIGKPIFWGVTTDINNNPYLFSQKMCRDAATYYGGYKPHRLLEVSEISRVASDFANGGWTANTARARIADPDRLFRSITAQPSLINRTAWLYAYSEAIRAVQGNPTLLFHGKIYNDPFAYNLTYELNINDYIGSQYGVLRDDLMIPQRTVGTDDFPNRPNASDGLGIPIIGGTHSKTDGAIKVYSVGTRTVGGTSYVMAMVAGHACAGGITQAYDSSGATLNWGTDAFAPGQASWTTIQPGGQLYYDINGNRYTLIFIVASSSLGVDFISGATSIYVNTSGMEATGTGSGAVILDLLTLYKYLMVQWFTQSYLGGTWLPGLTFEFFPGMGVSYDVVNEDSFDAASVQSAVYLGGGFVGGFVIGAGGTRVSIRQMLQICNTSCNVWMGVDAQSRIFVNMFNTNRATFLGSARTITDRRDIVKPGLSITPKYEWFANQLAYQYSENYRQDGRGRWDGFNIQGNAPSIDKYGAVRGTRTYGLINDTATADEVGQQQLTFGGIDPPRIVTWPQSLCGMQNDILSGVPITDFNGMYAPGWVDNAVYIIGQKLTPRNCTVTFTGVDAQALVS